MSVLTYQQRAEHWEWCRDHIDRQCIWRATPEFPSIPGKAAGARYIWQFYLRRGTFHADFSRRLGLLFWDHFAPVFAQQPFQIAACVPSGPPIAVSIQSVARSLGININAFLVRRSPKAFGVDNWFDGRMLPNLPVLLVDDIAASAPFLLLAAARVRQKLRLPLHFNYFCIVNKVGRGFDRASQHTENYPPGELVALYTMNDFCKSVEQYRDRYGDEPKWAGIVK
jgi:orotate phosphoribosyltransferase